MTSERARGTDCAHKAGGDSEEIERPMPLVDVRRMNTGDLDTVAAIESDVYEFPWSRGNFADAIQAGYDGWVFEAQSVIIGYAIVMWLPDEVHLLNVSVVRSAQGRGYGRALMHWLMANVAGRGAPAMMLEVRPSNTVARSLYDSLAFRQIGVRRRYYPAALATREDALVLRRMFVDE